jgi:uncharacterized membrane protein (DUF2068 family)
LRSSVRCAACFCSPPASTCCSTSTDFGHLAERIIRSIDIDPREHFFHGIVARLHRLHARELRIAGIAALGYGGLELVEGVGLWLDQLWAE